jgi:ribosomal protein S18 acetylase RimI-like enzyme
MGFRVRPATVDDAADIARIHVESWRTAYAGIYDEHVLASFPLEKREREWRDTLADDTRASFEFVAEDAQGKVFAFISAGSERSGDPDFAGQVYAIHVLPAHKGLGIGRSLMSTATKQLVDHGIGSLLVWVLTENHPARNFYEKLGGELARTQKITVGGQTVDEVGYGWKDICTLVG